MNAQDPILSTPFNPRSLLTAVVARRWWVIIAGGVFLILGLAGAAAIWRPVYTVSIQLRRYESPLASDAYRPESISTTALLGMVSMPEVLHKTGAAMSPPVPGESLLSRVKLTEERTNDLTTVTATGKTLGSAVDLVNRFSQEMVRFTQAMQRRDATEANRMIKAELAVNESDRTAVLQQLTAMQTQDAAGIRARMLARERDNAPASAGDAEGGDEYAQLARRDQLARDQLADLEGRYTDVHPLVREQKARVAALDAQLAQSSRTAAVSSPRSRDSSQLSDTGVMYDNQSAPYVALALRLSAIEKARSEFVARQRATELFIANPPGYWQMLHTATDEDVLTAHNRIAIVVLGVLCGGFGALAAILIIVLSELFDDRIKTSDDVRRIVQLPMLATLGDLRSLSAEAKEQWGYRTWRALQHRLQSAGSPGLVCGFTSSRAGEGRSTWIQLLAEAARRSGYRVLSGSEAALPSGSAWGPEQRRQWLETVKAWEATENLVVLIELPPAANPRTTHLAEALPAVVWISASQQASAAETLDQLEVLKHSRARLIGAGLNRDRGGRPRFARWIGRTAAIGLVWMLASGARAEESPLTTAHPATRAAWQEHLTLGPGDLLNLSVFGQPELLREAVPIGPDGRISYLEAVGIMAAGLTVDELRAALTQELGKYRNSGDVVITPVAYRSKKYFVLGGVVHRGAYPLDRPLTIIEAVSQAGGLDSGNAPGRAAAAGPALPVDFSRSMLARQGKHMPVDFEKLFLQGDLSQNIPLEPGDYLYFPTGLAPEVYVLGEVKFPGAMSLTAGTTAVEAIAARGGFTLRAWRGRILVVRGSLNHPQTFIIDAHDILSATAPDIALRPKDIVYISARPWHKVEELLDAATSAFIEGSVVTATGLHVDPIGGN